MSKVDSIKARLKNLAIKEGKQFDYYLMLYFIERLLYRLSISNYTDAFVLKGGLFLYTILDKNARATKWRAEGRFFCESGGTVLLCRFYSSEHERTVPSCSWKALKLAGHSNK